MQHDSGATEVVASEAPGVEGGVVGGTVFEVDCFSGEGGEGCVEVVVEGGVGGEGEADEGRGLRGGDHAGDEGGEGRVLEGGVGVAG